jgi:threonine dehydrogenase-like Zn-dependent dehydrogenase
VQGIKPGDLVVAPFIYSDMSCPHCLNGSTISCPAGGNFGAGQIDGGQGEAVRVPLAGSTLVPVPGSRHSDATLRSLLALSDVMPTGHHAAPSAGVVKGDTVAVVGDGAVGLCAVLAARRLGAERIISLSRHAGRQEVAREFGATDFIEERGEEASGAVLELTGGIVGVPYGQVPFAETFFRNTGWRGGPAPARIYIPELLGDVLDGAINPGRVFDYETDLDHIADAYRAMDERRAIKSLVRVGAG